MVSSRTSAHNCAMVLTPSLLMSLPSSGDSIQGGCCRGGKPQDLGSWPQLCQGPLLSSSAAASVRWRDKCPPPSPWSKWHQMHLVIVSLRLAQHVPVATPHLLMPTGQLRASTLNQQCSSGPEPQAGTHHRKWAHLQRNESCTWDTVSPGSKTYKEGSGPHDRQRRGTARPWTRPRQHSVQHIPHRHTHSSQTAPPEPRPSPSETKEEGGAVRTSVAEPGSRGPGGGTRTWGRDGPGPHRVGWERVCS